MRDILIIFLVVAGSLMALRRPWVGVLVWTWLSLMNPHRYAWGLAFEAPLAAMAAASTLAGLLMTRERESPFKGAPVAFFVIFVIWMTVSWLLGLDPRGDYEQWSRVVKIDLMIIVALALLRTKEHIFAFAWVCAASLALLGAKGGLFTLLTAGNFRVWGPPGSFITDNNAFALALVMTIPLLRFLQLQLTSVAARRVMLVTMILLAAAALGSHSRGGLLAIAGMTMVLWWRGRNKVVGAMLIGVLGIALVGFMPDEWSARMATIETYEADRSAMGRISAWWVSWNLAFDYPTGVGFNASRIELFDRYSPYQGYGTPVAHSIYFQVLGHHGFVGLALFLAIWISTWFMAQRVRRLSAAIPEARWCSDLAGMCQVSLAGYAVGGAFLNLSYFDLPYNIMALVVLSHTWLQRRGWQDEPVYQPGWKTIPGLSVAPQAR